MLISGTDEDGIPQPPTLIGVPQPSDAYTWLLKKIKSILIAKDILILFKLTELNLINVDFGTQIEGWNSQPHYSDWCSSAIRCLNHLVTWKIKSY
ncbi:hypothetical protein AVEN_164167-1 [Araneus ventricosus]|uniref:Uncharacterized protein n=1 Tax=Araneus ventricosus TaxID=182803 RepID=A0A4Y2SYM1_ARAVE|nr:hypothetical protein AVEN_164167-1 [Araneus ventricosus]